MNQTHRHARVRRFVVFLGAILMSAAATNAPATGQAGVASASGLVISQVYGGGGNSGATYKQDFVELFNAGSAPVSLAGLSIQYTSATGTGNFGANNTLITDLPAVTLGVGQYYLVREAQGSGGTIDVPAPDLVDPTPINMSGTGGKVALVNSAVSLGCNGSSTPCTPAQLALIVDLVGWGAANFYEGPAAAPATTNATAALRAGSGCTDADDNSADFTADVPTPRNTASPLHACAAPTNPSGTGAASPAAVYPGDATLLTVAVTPGANPASTGISVTTDLSAIGGSATQSFYDDGSNGDVTPGDNTFSFSATVAVSTTPGAKSLAVSIADAQSRSGNTSIALTINAASTNPSGVGTADPSSLSPGDSTTLAVAVTPGTGPPSTAIGVSADLTAIGGLASQPFYDDGMHGDVVAGDNNFTFLATVAAGTAGGAKSLPVVIADAQGRTGSTSIALTVVAAAGADLKISQVYGGGGNTGAIYKNDFIELYNAGSTVADVTGWSVQYASASGTTWQATTLSGALQPGKYYLVQEAAGSGGTMPLPTPDAVGSIPMAAANGKVALVSNSTPLTGACPSSAAMVDFVGYGSANCSETSPTAALSNTTAAIRNGNGSVDTENNLADFTVGPPYPRSGIGRPPTGTAAAAPASLPAGTSTTIVVTVTPGVLPPSTGLAVTADLGPIGGSATQAFYDDGTHGDVVVGDNNFTYNAAVPGSVAPGSKSIAITVADAQARSSTTTLAIIIEAAGFPIHTIQGPGSTSPYVGQLVATTGVVTGIKYNGFFIQTPDAEIDADPSTSEGIFVFTSTTPAVIKGSSVKVAGTVAEYVPTGEPPSTSMTEIGGTPTVTLLPDAWPFPAAYTLTAFDLDPLLPFGALERLEGMLVHVDALRVVAPTGGTVAEATATSTSSGVFYGVIDGMIRPFREAGIPNLDPIPAGAPCCVPRFDENPERLRIDSDGQGGAVLDVASGALVTNVTGPLEFAYRTWTISPDAASPPVVIGGPAGAVAVPVPGENEFTVASYNLERFFDATNDPAIGDPVLTADAFSNRLNKASLGIRHVMLMPDVVGVQEVENLATIQALAAKINADAVAEGQPNPDYAAYLVEGNDPGGIDVGFLVKQARVLVADVTQVGKDATYINPNTGSPELLNDRPPLVLKATIQGPIGSPFPVTVIVNHLRSMNGIGDETTGEGARVRAKRAAQAEFLANLIQSRQAADPAERIVSVGDFNAFAVNDGYADLIGTIEGVPAPADDVVVASPDLVNPDLASLVDLLPIDQAYSYVFDGNTQTLDHIQANASLMQRFTRFHYARNNADFPESLRNDPTRPERLSDHDMPVAYFAFPGAPTLVLNGPNPMLVECCTAFVDPGATASDEDLGDLTSSIVVSGSVDPHAVGSYVLTYSVSNGFVTSTATRTVNVVDTTPPIVTLNGDAVVTIELGGTYAEQGASAADTCAGALPVQISGTVDTSVRGVYLVTYTANDGYNATSVTRTVNVVAPPLTLVGRAAGRQVQLNWSNVGVEGYAIYRASTAGGPYVRIARVPGTQFLYLERNLTVGATYYWVVRSLDAGGSELAQSNEVGARISGR